MPGTYLLGEVELFFYGRFDGRNVLLKRSMYRLNVVVRILWLVSLRALPIECKCIRLLQGPIIGLYLLALNMCRGCSVLG